VAASRTIIVAGAGIGGLTTALVLARQGFRVVILEKAERLEEAGAGVQLSPNASRVLVELGLREKLACRAVIPEAISLMSARRGREIARLPLETAATFHQDAPYWVIHRADLQAALRDEVGRVADIDLRLGCQFEDLSSHAKGLTVVQRSGIARREEPAMALIGADGIWSAVRRRLFPQIQPHFSGLIAWRGVIEANQLPREYTSRRLQLWLGPRAHLVAYPISGGRQINLVAVVKGTWNRPGWSEPGESNEIRGAFASAGWHAVARMMIGAVDNWRKWALFTVPEGGEWSDGAVALLGDAAHAMLPFAAQGAAMAIEDAAVLAKSLNQIQKPGGPNIPAALKHYESLRRPRVLRVLRTARQQGRIYHLANPMAFVRDLVIRTLGPRRMLARQSWIYDWRA
jgi:salicylate hydroxylase